MYEGMVRLAAFAGAGAIAGVLVMTGSASASVGASGQSGASVITGTAAGTLVPRQASRVPAAKGAKGANNTATRVAVSASAPESATVPIKGQYQETDYYCVPASASVSLATLGVHAGQKALAKRLKTTAGHGTYNEDTLPVLESYASPKGYAYDWADASTGSKVMNAVAYDTGTLKKATVMGVYWEKLPWNKGLTDEKNIGHFIAIDGYDRATKTIKVWDPWRATGGQHTITAAALSHAAQEHGLMYITKK